MKVNKIIYNASAFPEVLRNIPAPPKELYVLGNIDLLNDKICLSVVGSRKVTPYGRAVTSSLIQEVAKHQVVIVSGLALGVDALAHRASLDVGGKTIAVLPCGLDSPQPATNRGLAKEILQKGGLLISEYPEGTPPLRPHFIARNRLVSGLSKAVLITEAAAKSGTLHTANFALEQGKTVMAVPGNINSELSRGTNNLIKTGALPVTEASDILQALGLDSQLEQTQIFGANSEEDKILELMKQGVTDASDLLIQAELDSVIFNQTLTMLEITGKIRPTGAGHWTIC